MSRLLRPRGVIVLVTVVFLLGWVGILPPASAAGSEFLAYSAETNRFTISPTGVDDTENLQAAFDGCAASGSECTVQLAEGGFHTAQIVVHDFLGTFQGMGEALTEVEALPNLPVGQFVSLPPSAENPWPILFTFFDGTYAISGITFNEPYAAPVQAWEACAGCGAINALFAMISVTGLHANAVVDHITMMGAPGDWATPGGPVLYNMINGIFPQALVLPHGKRDFSRVIPIQVNFELTNSAFYMIDNPSGAENLEDSVYTARYNTLDTVEYGFWFVNTGNSVIDVSHNVLRNVIYGTGVVAYQNRPINHWMPCQPHADVLIRHNDFQFTGSANGVILVDYGDRFKCEKSLDGVVSGNTFRSDETSWEAVLTYMMRSAVVTGNEMIGATSTGVYIWKGTAVVLANRILGGQIGIALNGATGALIGQNDIEDSLDYGIVLYGGSSYNLVARNDITSSTGVDLGWDQTGTGNTWFKNECLTSDPPGLCTAG